MNADGHGWTVRVVDEGEVAPELDRRIRELLCRSFSGEAAATFAVTRAWNGSGPAFSAIVERYGGGGVVGHVGVVDRVVRVGEGAVRVAGVQNVAVDPGWRGCGVTDRTMGAAMGETRRRGFDVGVLFCVPGLVRFYGRMGWKELGGVEITRVHEGVSCGLAAGNVAMWLPLGKGAFPAGAVDLNGDDW